MTWLEQTGLINTLHQNKTGKTFIKSPKKLYPENTNLIHAAYIPLKQDDMTGKIRETFFVNKIKSPKNAFIVADNILVGSKKNDSTILI